MTWRVDAACQGKSDIFFHPTVVTRVPKTLGEAVRICATCEVQEECAEDQEKYPAFGVYGGRWHPAEWEKHAR